MRVEILEFCCFFAIIIIIPGGIFGIIHNALFESAWLGLQKSQENRQVARGRFILSYK